MAPPAAPITAPFCLLLALSTALQPVKTNNIAAIKMAIFDL